MISTENKHRTLLIGCGKMGGALLEQWAKSPHHTFTVSDPGDITVPGNVTHVSSSDALESTVFDSVIIAIKPQLIEPVLPDYSDRLKSGGYVASIVAGASARRLTGFFPNADIIRIMPNLPSMIGKGVAGLYTPSDTDQSHKTDIETLMKRAGQTVWVDSEDRLDRVTAVAGSGPGYVFEFARTYVEAAIASGFSRDEARRLVLETIAGTIDMAIASPDSLETLRNNVTSKNGTTQAGLEALNGDEGLSRRLADTINAAYTRAVELR